MADLGFDVAEDVLYQPVDQELVLLNLKSQKYYGLDPMGARMWHLLVEHHNIDAVTDCICREFEADRSQVRQDVETMVADFVAAGLVRKY